MPHFKHTTITRDIESLIFLLRKNHFEETNLIELYTLDNLVGNTRGISYNYNVPNLVFNLSSSMKALSPVQRTSVTLDLYYELVEGMSDIIDVFNNYSLELYIKGYAKLNDDHHSKFFCWHLDKEINTNGRYAHPLYHFHAGGKKLAEEDKGALLMIGSPRIPHPPMDIILAIHFILRNFIDADVYSEQMKILEQEDYIMIIERAQRRVLDPYFHTFNKIGHTSYTRQNLFPLYL